MRQTPLKHLSPSPDAASLRVEAIKYLARFSATEASLTRVLLRKVDRWQGGRPSDQEAASARAEIARIVHDLVSSGAVSDEAFAAARARALTRAGRSRRAVGAHLAARGVSQPVAAASLPENDRHELAAALIHARKRRIGPWRSTPPTPEQMRRELGSLARAGFARGIAATALRHDKDQAEALIAAFRSEL